MNSHMYARNLIYAILVVYIVYLICKTSISTFMHAAVSEPLYRFIACVLLFYAANYDLVLGLLLTAIFVIYVLDVLDVLDVANVNAEKYPPDK